MCVLWVLLLTFFFGCLLAIVKPRKKVCFVDYDDRSYYQRVWNEDDNKTASIFCTDKKKAALKSAIIVLGKIIASWGINQASKGFC